MKSLLTVIVLPALLIAACSTRDKNDRPLDTPTSGFINITADESLRPLIEAQIAAFEGIYAQADIECSYVSESDAVDELMKDSARLAIVTRKFTVDEKKYFTEQMKFNPPEITIATSAIALVVNRQNTDSLISLEEIKAILQGKITTWDQLGNKSKAGIEIVFDSPNSGMIRHLKDSIGQVDKLPANCFAASNNEAVIDLVSKNINALGLIGVEWISDKNDSLSNSFLNKIKVVGVSVSKDSTHYQPYQAYIALKQYPLTRKVTILCREARTGLGNGFIAFVASERGQRIVLKMGLVPATMPLRIVKINKEPFQIE